MPQPKHRSMDESYLNIYDKYLFDNAFAIKQAKPKRKYIKKRKKLSLKTIFVLAFCFFLLFVVLPYSFKAFIRDVFPSKIAKYLNINYQKVLYPAQSMFPQQDLSFGNHVVTNIKYEDPLMIDIPKSFERIGLKNSLLILADKYKRIYPSVFVWEYDGKSYVDINSNEPFPAASIIKLPVLIEMFRAIEQGKFSLYDTMVFEDYHRADGSGKLQYSQGGIAHTFDHLAKIMIENSDNSSTNMIISKIGGMPEVNRAMRGWGLKTTNINNLLPDLGGTNVTTASELAKILYNIDITGIISDNSKKQIAGYMTNVRNTRLLKAGLPDNAVILHKTGDIGFMLGDAGIVKAPNGKKYIVVILVRRPYNNQQGKDFIVKASSLIYNNIAF